MDFVQIYNYFNSKNDTNEFELPNILRNIDSVDMLDQSIMGSFWIAATEKQVKFLASLKPQISIEIVQEGLNGTPRQAITALKLIKESFKDLVDTLKEDILAAAQGDSIQVCVEAGTLLLQEDPQFVIQMPWFLKRLSSVAEAPVPLEKRIDLIQLLCRQASDHSHLQLEYYMDRDKIVENLLSENHHLALTFYLRAALNRWQSVTGDPGDLVWLLENYKKIKESAGDNEGELTLKGEQGILSLRSKIVLEAAMYEVAVAGSEAIIRCINGPGGEHTWGKFTKFMSDKDLAEEVLLALSRDPRSLALLAEDEILEPESFNHKPQETAKLLTHGVLAAQHCLKEILKLCLNTVSSDQESCRLCLEKIDSEKNNLYSFAPDLFDRIASS